MLKFIHPKQPVLRHRFTKILCARSLSHEGRQQAWMNSRTMQSALDDMSTVNDLESAERMLVTALFTEDRNAVNVLSRNIRSKFKSTEWHEDTLSNLILAERGNHEAVIDFAEPEILKMWVSSWEDQEQEEGWVGGVGGGRSAALSCLLEAVLVVLRVVEPRPRIRSPLPGRALDLILGLYSNMLRYPNATVAALQEPVLVRLVQQVHIQVKHWRLVSGGTSTGTEDALVSSVVASALTSLAGNKSAQQPALALMGLLQPAELKLGIQVYGEQVLPLRSPSAARRDAQLLLDVLCPMRFRTSYATALSGNFEEEQEQVQLNNFPDEYSGSQWKKILQRDEDTRTRARHEASSVLFRMCLLQEKTYKSTIIGPMILERLLRVAGAVRDKDLFDEVLSVFESKTHLTANATRRITASAFLALQDWLYSREEGPAGMTVAASELNHQPDVSIKGGEMPPSAQWETGRREAKALLNRLCAPPRLASNASYISFASQQADKLCGRYFAVILRDCAARQQWRSCEGMLEAWLGEYDVGALHPGVLYLLTTAFIHSGEPLKALRLLEIAHERYGVKPNPCTIRLLCIRLSKSHGSTMAERCWKLGIKVHYRGNEEPCALYDRIGGYQSAGPCLATYRSRWLAWDDNKAELQKHLKTCENQFLLIADGRKGSARAMLFPLYHAVIRAYTYQVKDVDLAIFYLRVLVKLPGARQNGTQMQRTVDAVMNTLMEKDRALRGATLVNELRSYRFNPGDYDRNASRHIQEDVEDEDDWWPN